MTLATTWRHGDWTKDDSATGRQFLAVIYAIKFAVELLLFVASGALRVNARYFFNCFTFDAIDSAL